MYILTYVPICILIYKYTSKLLHICIRIYINTQVNCYISVYVYINTCTFLHMYIHTFYHNESWIMNHQFDDIGNSYQGANL